MARLGALSYECTIEGCTQHFVTWLRVHDSRYESVPLKDTSCSRRAGNGLEAWAQVLERGYEGLVGKDPDSPYREGRTLSWLKVKQQDYRVEERGWDPRNKS